jgi:hypothetical protein
MMTGCLLKISVRHNGTAAIVLCEAAIKPERRMPAAKQAKKARA